MSKAKHVYVTYIRTTPEKIWDAITLPKITRQYWFNENISTWRPGTPWSHESIDGEHKTLLVGKVVEFTRPHRLVLTWADPQDADHMDKHSRVTFELTSMADMVRVTVTHDELMPGSDMEHGIDEGWPRVLSSLKSFLETGRALDTWLMKKEAVAEMRE